MATIIGEVSYVDGYLRYGHYELEIPEEQVESFKSMKEIERAMWIRNAGEFVLDDYEVNGIGEILS